MNPVVKIVIALVIAAIAATTVQTLGLAGAALYAAFAIAAVMIALLPSRAGTTGSAGSAGQAGNREAAQGDKAAADAAQGDREFGTVKWFNVSKGFGFITKDDGEEIFVHFRSIRGTGRRGLRDGQRVSFVVAQSEKGPQAEDVDGID